MTHPELTPSCLYEMIVRDRKVEGPIVQVLELRVTHNDQVKLAISDGKNFCSAVLSTQAKRWFDSGDLVKFSIIRLTNYVINRSHGKLNVILLVVDVLSNHVDKMIGIPQPIKNDANPSQEFAAGTPPPQSAYQPPPPAAPAYQPPQQTYQPSQQIYQPPPQTYQPPQQTYQAPQQPHQTPQQNYQQNYQPTPPQFKPPSVYNQQQPYNAPLPPTYNAPPAYQPQRMPTARPNSNTMRITPISMLNNYTPTFNIVGRIINRTGMRTFKNGKGKLFSITIKDSQDGVIRGSFFNQTADKFDSMLELNKVYRFTGGRVKASQPRFKIPENDYEISFDENTDIVPEEDTSAIGGLTYRFTKLNDLNNHAENSSVDIIGYVTLAEEPSTILTKDSRSLLKRRLEIVDDSNTKVELTLWGDDASNFNEKECVVAIKDAKIGTFRGRSLSVSTNSILSINPEIPEAALLRQWYAQSDPSTFVVLSGADNMTAPNILLREIDDKRLGFGQKGDYFTVTVVLLEIISNRKFVYPACSKETCKNKGLTQQQDGVFLCPNCSTSYQEAPKHRFNFSIKVGDSSGSVNANVIGDEQVGELIFGMSADELWNEIGPMEDIEVRQFVAQKYFRNLKLKIRARLDNYQGDSRIKLNVVAAQEVSFGSASIEIDKEIDQLG